MGGRVVEVVFFSSRRRHTRCALVTGVQTCALPILTFTNKAAREMRERIGRMIGDAVEGMPWLGTFHSIAAKMLRRHAELVGLQSNFTILDTDDQLRVLKQLIQAEGLDEKRWPARQLAGLIDKWKNRGQIGRAHV